MTSHSSESFPLGAGARQVIWRRCPAKLNLALSVGAPRNDGRHPVESWMAAIAFADNLELAESDQESAYEIECDIVEAPRRFSVDWPLEADLAVRAHQRMEAAAGRPLPVGLHLEKCIPPGGGLGGGSSDAAATMVILNDLFELGMDRAALLALAAELGSDVPFLVSTLLGDPSALAHGLGEQVEPVPRAAPLHLVLVLPPFGCRTGAVYERFDAHLEAGRADPMLERDTVRALAEAQTPDAEALFNDLAAPAMEVEPRLAELAEKLRSEAGRPVHVSGSGAALFMLAGDREEAADLADALGVLDNLDGAVPMATRTLVSEDLVP